MAALLSVPFFALTYHQVCVRRPCSRLHSCASTSPKDIYPNPTAVKDNRKCPINDPDKTDGEGETCVGSLLRRGHTTWPSAELTCSGRGRAAGCFVANFRPHTNSQTRAGHTWYKKDLPYPLSTNCLKLSTFKGYASNFSASYLSERLVGRSLPQRVPSSAEQTQQQQPPKNEAKAEVYFRRGATLK